MQSTGHNMLAKAAQAIVASSGDRRVDLALSDVRAVNSRTMQTLVTYRKDMPRPERDVIAAFVTQEFSGKVRPMLDEIVEVESPNSKHGAIICLARLTPETQAYDSVIGDSSFSPIDCKNRTQAKKFVNTVTAKVWDVEQGETGPIVIRHMEEDMDGIIRARFQKKQVKASGPVSFAQVNVNAGVDLYECGDTVKFAYGNRTMLGKIQSCNVRGGNRYCSIKSETGEVLVIPQTGILDLVERGAAADSADTNESRNYYEQAFGDADFARRMTAK